MAVDLRTTQEYLNAKLGTVGLTKQQCLQRLAGGVAPLASNPMTAQDSALNYGATNSRTTVQGALKTKVGASVAGSDNVVLSTQEIARRL